MNSQMLFDALDILTYDDAQLDTTKALWFVADLIDTYDVGGNAVSLAAGATTANLTKCVPFLKAFPAVFLALADSQKREEVAAALTECVPTLPILLPREGAFGRHQNVRGVMGAGGRDAVDRLIFGAIERPAPGLLDLADVEYEDMSMRPVVLSGISALDRSIGGFYGGELSVWTGKRGSGKSTILGQFLLEAINQGQPVCAYSGELPAWQFKNWIYQQAAGPAHIEKTIDPFSGLEIYTVPPLIRRQVDEWLRGKFLLYDNRAPAGNDEDSILDIFNYAVRRYGCSVFLVDNLMTARFGTSSDKDFYRAQSNFTGRLVGFAKANEVHVHLVAHPRKGDGGKINDADEVGGSGDVTNRADNVFSLQRLTDEAAGNEGFQSVLRVIKNRARGVSTGISLNFDAPSRRFYKAGTGTPDKRYGWDCSGKQEVIQLPSRKDGEPF